MDSELFRGQVGYVIPLEFYGSAQGLLSFGCGQDTRSTPISFQMSELPTLSIPTKETDFYLFGFAISFF